MSADIILHCCCGPCATACVERLLEEGKTPLLYFSNQNILSRSEWEKRLLAAQKTAQYFSLDILEDCYNHDPWLAAVKGLEKEKEKGSRCSKCFYFSLERTALKAKELNISAFTTSLTVSPHKNSQQIFHYGKKLDGFQIIDFKKKNGFKRSLELSKKLGLYRQDFCACEFSYRKEY